MKMGTRKRSHHSSSDKRTQSSSGPTKIDDNPTGLAVLSYQSNLALTKPGSIKQYVTKEIETIYVDPVTAVTPQNISYDFLVPNVSDAAYDMS